jgi:uncharacterized lipoprotein NlpE involved in copper resistance
MKKIALILSLLTGGNVFAQVTAQQLMGAGMPAGQATIIAGIGTGGAVIANNTFLKARNAANSADNNWMKLDATDDLVLNAATGEKIKLSVNGTALTTIDAGGVDITTGRLREVMTAADVDAQNNTLTVAQIVGGIVVHTSVTGGGTVTTDTAANIIAGASGVGALTANGQSIMMFYVNDGTQTLTFAGGTSVTVADTGQTIAADESAIVVFLRTSGTAVTAYILGA